MLEVIGVGFGRTGTLSLKHALQILGYRKCYHFTTLLYRRDAKQWLDATSASSPDWHRLFRGYSATTDWPAAAFFQELAHAYPNALFILTHRNADEWYDSTYNSIFQLRSAMPDRWPVFRRISAITDRVIWDGTFDGRFSDRVYAIKQYHAHIKAVTDAIPRTRLLIFEVRDGWAPLCAFLDKPEPNNLEFPRLNDRALMQRYIKAIQLLKWLGPILMITLTGFVTYTVLR